MLHLLIGTLQLGAPAGPDAPAEDAEPFALEWRAPATCPDEQDVHARVASLVGGPPRGLTARAVVTGDATRWRLDVRVAWSQGSLERALESSSCDALADAAALLIAVVADPLATSERLQPQQHSVPPPPEPTAWSPDAPVDSAPAPSLRSPEAPRPPLAAEDRRAGAPRRQRAAPARDRGWGARAFAGLDVGSLPSVAPTLGAGATFRWPSVRAGLDVVYLPPSRLVADAPAGDGVVQLGAARGELCPRFYAGPVELPVCATLEVGATAASGFGPASTRGALNPWTAAALGVELRGRVAPRVALFLRLNAVIPLVLTSYQYDGIELYRAAPASFRANVGFSFLWTKQNPA